jgi:hypothetical protein
MSATCRYTHCDAEPEWLVEDPDEANPDTRPVCSEHLIPALRDALTLTPEQAALPYPPILSQWVTMLPLPAWATPA